MANRWNDVPADEMAKIPGRVSRGVAWMRKTYPDFKPDPESLDMNNNCHCILGQKDGNFFLARRAISLNTEQLIELGLLASDDSYAVKYHNALTSEWRRQLAEQEGS